MKKQKRMSNALEKILISGAIIASVLGVLGKNAKLKNEGEFEDRYNTHLISRRLTTFQIKNYNLKKIAKPYLKWRQSAKEGGINAAHYDGGSLPGEQEISELRMNEWCIKYIQEQIKNHN